MAAAQINTGDSLFRHAEDGRLLAVKRLANNKKTPQWLIVDPKTNKNLLIPNPEAYQGMLEIWMVNGWQQVIEVPWTNKLMLVPINNRADALQVQFIKRSEL